MVPTTFSNWAEALNTSFQDLFYNLVTFIPNLVVALVIFVVGWLIGVGVGRVVEQVVEALRVDQALKAAGVDKVVSRAGFTLSSGKFLGFLVKWFFIIVFLIAALNVLDLKDVNEFISTKVINFLGDVIVAVLILLVGAVIATSAERVVTGSARAAELHAAGFIGQIAKWVIWIFAIFMALNKLGVSDLISTLFTGVVIALALAFGLAFGLGGQAAAGRYIEHLRGEMKE